MLKKTNFSKVVLILALLFLSIAIIGAITDYIEWENYPRPYKSYVEAYSNEFLVPEYVIYSVMKIESDFDEKALSQKGACGLMQLLPSTYGWLTEKRGEKMGDIFDPCENIKYGTYYLSMLYSKYKSWSLALCAYNAGSGNVDNWLKSEEFEIPLEETKNYVKKNKVAMEKYKALYYG